MEAGVTEGQPTEGLVDSRVYADLIEDGFIVRPPAVAAHKPQLFAIEEDVTHNRILEKYKSHKGPVDQIEALLEYRLTYCYTFYESCARAALRVALTQVRSLPSENGQPNSGGGQSSAAGPDSDEDEPLAYGLPASAANLLAQVEGSLAAIEAAHRERLAYLRYRYSPDCDQHFQRAAAKEIFRVCGAQSGSADFDKRLEQFSKEYHKAYQLQAAKDAVKKIKKGEEHPKEKEPKKNPKKEEPKPKG